MCSASVLPAPIAAEQHRDLLLLAGFILHQLCLTASPLWGGLKARLTLLLTVTSPAFPCVSPQPRADIGNPYQS